MRMSPLETRITRQLARLREARDRGVVERTASEQATLNSLLDMWARQHAKLYKVPSTR